MKWIFALLVFLPVTLHAATNTKPINFGGGLNVKTIATDIEDTESPDMSNMVNDLYGASFKRRGSSRYIGQAFSSHPVTGLFRVYAGTGTTQRKATIAMNWDRILVSTKPGDFAWVSLSNNLTPGQKWSMATMNNHAYLAGDSLNEPMRALNIINTSISNFAVDPSTFNLTIRAKYLLNSRNQMLAANIVELTLGTTYYPSRLRYTPILEPSTFTWTRYIDIRANDGEEITGLGELGNVHIFKPSSISELSYTILDPDVTTPIGDQQVKTLVLGFGCIAPQTLRNVGPFYIFLAKDGIRAWDPRSRLSSSEESKILSVKIQPIIDDLIRAGTYRSAVGIYYPKKQWYVFAFEDPNRFPRGRNNSVLVYDLVTGNWFPFKNWLVGAMAVQDGFDDKGELLYGDSADGYVYFADQETALNDARKEVVIHTMDNQAQWTGAAQDVTNVKEGTASCKITLDPVGAQSSMTYLSIINAGEWYDKSKISKDDKLSFQIFATTLNHISSIRVDLEVNDVSSAFDTNFTSVTISSASFTGGNNAWSTIEIALSSFPIRPDWTDLSVEAVPFANALTFYGVRFVLNGISSAAASIDNVRIVQNKENPLNAYRITKQFEFGLNQSANFDTVSLVAEKTSDSLFYVDIAKNFSEFLDRKTIPATVPKHFFVADYNNGFNLTKLDSVDFSFVDSTGSPDREAFSFQHINADGQYIYAGDDENNRILKFSISSMTALVGSFGSFGSGTTNFNGIHQIGMNDNKLFIADWQNHRVKIHNKANLQFVDSIGSLGTGASNFHIPTGVTADPKFLFVCDDGNYRIMKFSIGNGTYPFQISTQLDFNTAGECSLANDETYLYVAYNKIAETSINHTDVILEKRNKSDLKLVNRVVAKPDGSVALSTHGIYGDIALGGDFLFLPLTNDQNGNGNYYLQKRLKSDFSIVRERSSSQRHFGVAMDGLAYKPKLRNEQISTGLYGTHLQLRYSEDGLDNSMRLYRQVLAIEPHEVKR